MKTTKYQPSCDTLIAMPSAAKGSLIFAKNSDRAADESQPLVIYPAASHGQGEKVECTYISIPQVEKTNRVIGSKPWWIWGFEHGINEYGVVAGNEAAWSTIPVSDTNALLGMDLLRLGLERGNTAYETLHVITDLLEKYSQGGACNYGCSIEDFSYHNTFIIADTKEAWVLETVRKHWVAKRVKEFACISNLYSIEEDFDECSEGIEDYAVSQGLHIKGTPFNFAKSFVLFTEGYMSGYQRYRRMNRLLADSSGGITADTMKGILRDHYEGEMLEAEWGPTAVYLDTVCMHGMGKNPCQTAASTVVEMHPNNPKELLFTYWGSMCAPCTSFFIPFYNTGYIPEELKKGTNKYEDNSFWWKVYRFCLAVEANYKKYIKWVSAEKELIEKDFIKQASETEGRALKLLESGKTQDACSLLNQLTDDCLQRVTRYIKEATEKIEADVAINPGDVFRSAYLSGFRQSVGLK